MLRPTTHKLAPFALLVGLLLSTCARQAISAPRQPSAVPAAEALYTPREVLAAYQKGTRSPASKPEPNY